MPVNQPFNVYREQLTSQYHGIALWHPNPVEGLYDCGRVSIGDVGYLCDGDFIRMFNVTLPWDNPSNKKLGMPKYFKSLEQSSFVNVRGSRFRQAEYHSPCVSKEENAGNAQAETPDEAKGHTYRCRARSRGALLSLPHGGRREDVIRTKAFKDYIRDHVDSWFTWAQDNELDVERMEDLILVTGCTLVTSWAAAAFDDYTTPVGGTTISLDAQKFDRGGAQFLWRDIRGNIEYHNSHFEPNDEQSSSQNQCVFIRGFRAKRIFFRTKHFRAAAEPLPDDPDNSREDEIQVTRIPDVSNHRDPLIGILDYIAEKCLEDGTDEESDIIVIAHDDDLQLIEDVETLTADTIEEFLHEKQMPLLVENGAASLRDPRGNEPDRLARGIQRWLSPPDPSTNHDYVWKAHHTGTSSWLFESDALTKWKKTGSFLWIHGKPGSGKSTLLSAIIQEIESMHAAGLATIAYYYFDFRDIKKQDLYGLLSSLVSQLSEVDPCLKVLSQLYLVHGRGARKPTTSTLTKCMKDMLSMPGLGPIYIIVDAVDECPDVSGMPSSTREEVLRLFEELVGLKLSNLHLCVATRPEIGIRKTLEPLEPLQISLHDESGQKDDIVRYIKSVVPKMWSWRDKDKELAIEVLSGKAAGMFRLVVCQFDRLRHSDPASIRSALADLPESLDETYEQTLLGIKEENQTYALYLFQCLSVSIRPLRVEELAAILAVRFDVHPIFNAAWRRENAQEAVLSACSSLIMIADREGGQVVQFSHVSVKEFLTSDRLAKADERLSYYHILPEPAHTLLAQACLGVLSRLDDKIDRNAIGDFPLAQYAARHWVDHAQIGNVASHIEEGMEGLFDPIKPHFAAWVWLYDIDRHWVDPMSGIHPTQPEAAPLYYAALCGFVGLVERLLGSHSSDINCRGGSHTTPLHAATVKGHVEVISQLLESGADPNSRDNLGRVPLHRVTDGGHFVMEQTSLEITRLLVNCGANVNVTDDEGCSPLHSAARNGYREVVQQLVESGASLDARNQKRQTPLHLSCGNGGLEVSRFLVDCGADVESRDNEGFIPIHSASLYGHVDITRVLLDHGCDVNVPETRRWTPLHLASRSGHLGLARLLIGRGANVSAFARERWTPLHFASLGGHLDVAKFLVEQGANVNSQSEERVTPLYCAAKTGHLDVARFLVESGAAVSTRDNNGWTPFLKASYCGHFHVADFLLECGIDFDIRIGGVTLLYLASSTGKLDVVRFLIEHGADINTRDNEGANPLYIASQMGHLDVVRFLFQNGAGIHAENSEGVNPLYIASQMGHLDVVRFLFKQGADFHAKNNEGANTLFIASQMGHLDVVRFLIENGADIDTRDNEGANPLHIASEKGHLDVVGCLINAGIAVDIRTQAQKTPLALASREGKVEVGRFLTEQGADVNARDEHSQAPLHLATQYGHLTMAKLLLDHGADSNVLDDNLWSPLHLASAHDHYWVAELLIECGARVDVFNRKQEIPLHLAAGYGKVEIARLLIDHGANLNTVDSNGWTPFHAASRHGHIEVVTLLIKRGADFNLLDKANKTAAKLASENGKENIARWIGWHIREGSHRRSTTFDSAQHGADEDGTNEGEDSLHAAMGVGNIDVMKSLLERGVDVNGRNSGDWTPLAKAAQIGRLDIVRLLVERGAQVDLRDKRGWTPLHFASRSGHLKIVKLLLEHGADLHALNDVGETPYQVSLQSGHRDIANLLREHSTSGSSI